VKSGIRRTVPSFVLEHQAAPHRRNFLRGRSLAFSHRVKRVLIRT
jgi:hypothetical protein